MLTEKKVTERRGPSPLREGHRRLAAAAGVFACLLGAAACSLLTNWDQFTAGDSGSAPDVKESGVDDGPKLDVMPVPVSCGPDRLCTPPIPVSSGWSGPLVLLSGDAGSPPTCDPATYLPSPAFQGNLGVIAPPPECSCTCGPLEGRTCSPPSVTFYPSGDTSCGSPCDGGAAVPIDGTCIQVPLACPGFQVGPTMPTGGGCTATTTMTLPPFAWQKAAVACEAKANQQGVCSDGSSCLQATALFCIMHAGQVSCPAGRDYTIQHIYFLDKSDTRSCQGCTCTATLGSCSFPGSPALPLVDAAAPLSAYTDTTCSSFGATPLTVPSVCFGTTGPVKNSLKLSYLPVEQGGECIKADPMPVGMATPTMPTTFCCTN